MLRKVIGHMEPLGADATLIRVVDHRVPFGVSGDLVPTTTGRRYGEIRAAQILLLGTAIWMGHRSGVA